MYKVDNTFLEDEVREGFYIPSIAKRAWAAELSVLSELDRICEKHGIRYFADWGTLLGAVRHGGFVPWDDDLDVCMFRADAEKFQRVAAEELPEGYRLYTFENSDYCWKFAFNLVNTERMNFTPEYLKENYNFPYMATIDIFVFDNVTEDEDYEESRREKVKYLLKVSDALKAGDEKSKSLEQVLSYLRFTYGITIQNTSDIIDIKRQLHRAVLSILKEKNDENTEDVCQMISLGIYYKHRFPRSYYNETKRLPFEGVSIPVPKQYDIILKNKYGKYKEIHMGGGVHGYPYYKSQKAALGLPADADYIPQYRFDDSLTEVFEERKNFATYAAAEEVVLFLPFKGESWDLMKPFYEAEMQKENVSVYVVPLPYFYKEYDGSFVGEAQYNTDAYPEELPGYYYGELDVQNLYADRIYIQNPYDEYNMCMSVPREFYASNLLGHTPKLIYVPWFSTEDFSSENYPQVYNMQYYCTVPGVVLADEVYVSTEVIRQRYIEKLTEFAGGHSDIWEKKIRVNETA